MPPFTPPPASHMVKPWWLWSRRRGLAVVLRQLDGRRAAEFAAPDDQRVVEQAALLEIGEQRGDGPGQHSRASLR